MRKIPLLLLCGFFGCTPKDQGAAPFCEISLVSTVEEALSNPLFEKGSWPNELWWEQFQDETLNGMIQQALSYNPGFLAAKQQVEQLREQAKVVYANLFPMLGLDADLLWAYLGKDSGSGASSLLSGNIHPLTVFLGLNYEFDFWGKNRKLFEAAVGNMKTQEALYAQSKLMLSVLIAELYFDLQASMKKEDLYLEWIEAQKQLFELSCFKLDGGLNNLIMTNANQEAVTEVEKGLIAVREEISLKKHALQKLMGQSVDENFIVSKNWQPNMHPAVIPEFIGSDLLGRRPDIMAKIWQVRSAGKNVGVAKTEFLPNINLGAGGGFFSFQYSELFTRNSLVGFLLPSFQLPIFTAGKLTANLKAKIATYQQMIQEYNDLVLTAVQQVADQVSVYRSVANRIEEQTLKSSLTEQDMQLTALRVDVGIDPFASYLTTKTHHLKEMVSLVDLQRSHYLAEINLIRVLGGGYLTADDASLCHEK